MPLLHHGAELRDELPHSRGVVRLSFDEELVALRADVDVEQRFEVAKVVVVGPEEGLGSGLRN
jgi:hypothetical protein